MMDIKTLTDAKIKKLSYLNGGDYNLDGKIYGNDTTTIIFDDFNRQFVVFEKRDSGKFDMYGIPIVEDKLTKIIPERFVTEIQFF